MTDTLQPPQSATGSDTLSQPLVPLAAVRPAGYAAPAQFSESHPEALAELAAQVLSDRQAVQRLSDRVVELLHRDLLRQQERSRGAGRRW
jgi:hypothetical protein